jgi:hypothetical protein
MTKEERKARWDRRKARGNERTEARGWVGGNPRYSGKSGDSYIDQRPQRNRRTAVRS